MIKLLLLVLLGLAYVDTYKIRVQKIRYCSRRRFWICWRSTLQGQYRFWDHARVGREKQKDTYLSEVYKPPVNKVKRLVFLAPGQQIGDGYYETISGSPNNWLRGWGSTQASKDFILPSGSLPYQLISRGYVRSYDTAFFLAFKHNFRHGLSSSNKQEMENAYYNWLKSSFDPKVIETIYLAGFSRGGCLVMRLAARFNKDFPNVRLIVNSYDGVCRSVQGELNTEYSRISSPVSSSSSVWARPANLADLFPNRGSGRLHIALYVGGHNPTDIPGFNWVHGVRAFSYKYANGETYEGCWIYQKWLNLGHRTIGVTFVSQHGVTILKEGLDRVNNGKTCGGVSTVTTAKTTTTKRTTYPPIPPCIRPDHRECIMPI